MPYHRTDDGVRLHYEVYGGGASDLILLHGMGGSGKTWRAVIDKLDLRQFRVLAPDMRGHGQSQGEPSSFSYERFNADIVGAATALNMRSATAVGFSGGAKQAIWLAADAPRLVRRVVLVAPPGLGIVPMERDILWPFFDLLTRSKKAPPEFEPWLTDKLGAYRESMIAEYATTPLSVLRAAAEMWFYGSVEESARRVTQPVLIMGGGREPLANAEYQKQTTRVSCPHADLHMFDCGHWIPFEEPVACARLITNFALAR